MVSNCPCGGTNEECFWCQGSGEIRGNSYQSSLLVNKRIIKKDNIKTTQTKLVNICRHLKLQSVVIDINERLKKILLYCNPYNTFTYCYADTDIWKNRMPKIGEFVLLHLKENSLNKNVKCEIEKITATNEKPRSDLYKMFDGKLKIIKNDNRNLFGFVEDIFVPPHLLRSLDPTVTRRISGFALRMVNIKRRTLGWRAVCLD